MIKLLIVAALALSISVGIRAEPKALPMNQPLRTELQRMADQDQATRIQAIKSPADTGAAYDMGYVDGVNTTRMKQIIERYGWPGRTLVGRDGSDNAWLLVQHADGDRPFQASCLLLMQKAAANGEAAPDSVALLTDRVLLHQGKRQIYGTQFLSVKDDQVTFKPIEDEANVDIRRKSVGLPPLSKYRQQIIRVYGQNYGLDRGKK